MKPDSLWLVTAPAETSNPVEQLNDLRQVLAHGKLGHASLVEFPKFKQDPTLSSSLQKTVETIRSLTSPPPTPSPNDADRSSPLSSHLVLDDGRPYLSYVFPEGSEQGQTEESWTWNKGKFRTESRSLCEVVEAIMKEAQSIENAQRNKSQQYAVVKGQLTSALRKKTGNLSMRSLADVVSASDFAGTNNSEYLETVLVAVPKNLTKDWEASYERLTQMVVPRSSTKLAQDDEFVLFSVTLFRRVRDEFAQKAREKKFIVRDFTYDAEAIEKQKRELEALVAEEKDLWADLLRLSRINFSELFQLLVHLKVVRAYVESVLRYGLPAVYFGAVVKPEPKSLPKLVTALSSFLVPSHASYSTHSKKRNKDASGDDAAALGEYASLMEGEYYDFVVFEIERVEARGD
ncbi:SPOSA6832_05006 [Sporobolomyces salmonicolor]|uniref:V-type proton ATPase subunit C n=1 Tax=Sporidiobolus salmonicolor TaxID=5005 RepID=A0A0D6ESK6_SPOSA|nr:SPOSA6832_05006 [Sporobolomyces salmonicolor]